MAVFVRYLVPVLAEVDLATGRVTQVHVGTGTTARRRQPCSRPRRRSRANVDEARRRRPPYGEQRDRRGESIRRRGRPAACLASLHDTPRHVADRAKRVAEWLLTRCPPRARRCPRQRRDDLAVLIGVLDHRAEAGGWNGNVHRRRAWSTRCDLSDGSITRKRHASPRLVVSGSTIELSATRRARTCGCPFER